MERNNLVSQVGSLVAAGSLMAFLLFTASEINGLLLPSVKRSAYITATDDKSAEYKQQDEAYYTACKENTRKKFLPSAAMGFIFIFAAIALAPSTSALGLISAGSVLLMFSSFDVSNPEKPEALIRLLIMILALICIVAFVYRWESLGNRK